MSAIKRFEDIEAWRKGRELKQRIYRFSKVGEFAKDFPLRDQTCETLNFEPAR
jgi:hypothetical protein